MKFSITVSNIDIHTNDCACANQMPRHVGVHPMTCIKCNGVIE